MTNPSTIEAIIKKFKARFVYMVEPSFIDLSPQYSEFQDFLQEELTTLLTSLIQEIEGKKQDILDDTPLDVWAEQRAYNDGIAKAITIIRTK